MEWIEAIAMLACGLCAIYGIVLARSCANRYLRNGLHNLPDCDKCMDDGYWRFKKRGRK